MTSAAKAAILCSHDRSAEALRHPKAGRTFKSGRHQDFQLGKQALQIRQASRTFKSGKQAFTNQQAALSVQACKL
jgi:hypothetical protein